METRKKMSRTQAQVELLKLMEPSESETRSYMLIKLRSMWAAFFIDDVFLHSALASILRAWLDQCPEDFQEPPDYPCLHRLMDYLRRTLPGSEALRRAEGLLEQLQTQAGMDDTEGIEQFVLRIVISISTFFSRLIICASFQPVTMAMALSAWGRRRSWRLRSRTTSCRSRPTWWQSS